MEDNRGFYNGQSNGPDKNIPCPLSLKSITTEAGLPDVPDAFVLDRKKDFLGCYEEGARDQDSSGSSENKFSKPDISKMMRAFFNLSKRMQKALNSLPPKPWSKMSSTEQLQTLETISEMITYQLTRVEQEKFFKIIHPSKKISANDTEFVLDASYLSDVKLVKMKQFIRRTLLFSTSMIKAGKLFHITEDFVKSVLSLDPPKNAIVVQQIAAYPSC